jgi:hypothetical protein
LRILKKIDTDAEMQLMYYLFVEHSIMPGYYYSLPEGEKVVIRDFFGKTYGGRRIPH